MFEKTKMNYDEVGDGPFKKELTVVSSGVVQTSIGRLHDVELGQLELALVADGVVRTRPDVEELVHTVCD